MVALTVMAATRPKRSRRSHSLRVVPEQRARLVQLVIPFPEPPLERPKAWSECKRISGPCAFVGCRHNTYLDVDAETGTIRFNFRGVAVEDLDVDTCSIAIANRGEHTLEEVGAAINRTPQRTQQLVGEALVKYKAARAAERGEDDDGSQG